MQQDLFNGSYSVPALTLDEIKSCDFDFFAHNPNIVSDVYSKTLDMFDDKKEVPFYHLYPSYNTVIRNNEYRFLVVKVGNNHWVYEYKIVHIVTTKQIRFFGLPKTDDTYVTSDMERIIRELASIEFVRFVFNESQRERIENILGDIRRSKRLWNHDEFFYFIDSDNEYFTSNRWKKKHYVNLLNCTSAFSHDVGCDVDIAETNNLRETWKVGMERKGDAVRQSTERSFQNFIRNIDKERFRIISLRYNGRLIAQEIFLLDKQRRVCQSLYCIHVFDYGDDILLKHIVNRMVAIQKYLSWVYLSDKASVVYVGTGANRKLYEHKKRTCDGKVEYYIM